jgi:meiotically up-regulated gene 157 (Mug157) protein
MSQIIYAFTSQQDSEIHNAVGMLKRSAAGFGFMHESYFKDDPKRFTRPWFAWANTLFGELIGTLAVSRPQVLRT